jgi:hypothetical protein
MALQKNAKRPAPPFAASLEIDEHQHVNDDACSLCHDPLCLFGECDDGDIVAAGWDICYGENEDGSVDPLDRVNYLSCLQDDSSSPPPRHPAAACLGDLLKLKMA